MATDSVWGRRVCGCGIESEVLPRRYSYRIQHDHWQNARALREAMSDGMSYFQHPRQNYIRNFRPRSIATPPGTATAAGNHVAIGTAPAAQ